MGPHDDTKSPSLTPQSGMDGDYDGDGDVDGRDFLAWQRGFGSSQNLAADGNHNGSVDGGDLTMWSGAYANSSSPSGSSGDFDGDGDGDGRDFLALQRTNGSTQNLAAWANAYANSSSLAATSGDKDGDSDVDGRDFLVLQRTGGASLAGWQANLWQTCLAHCFPFGRVTMTRPTTSVSSANELAPAACYGGLPCPVLVEPSRTTECHLCSGIHR